MKAKITIKWDEIQQQIDLKNFYMGESAKRRNADADTIQSCTDDMELLQMFANQASNTLVSAVAFRSPLVNYSIDSKNITFMFETAGNNNDNMLPMLQQAILDYLVNEIMMLWLLHRQPQMAQTTISLRTALYQNVMQLFYKLCIKKKMRRRATDLAGI